MSVTLKMKCFLLLVQLALLHLSSAWTLTSSYRLTHATQTQRSGATQLTSGGKRVAKANSFISMMAPPAAAFEWKPFKKSIDEKMGKCIDSTQNQFNSIRAGGANPSLLDRIFVDYFGTLTPLNQVARVAASGSQQLVVEPFDKTLLKEIEKAITNSDINITPVNDGSGMIRLTIPPLTEDRRKELAKQAKGVCEDGKVAVRNVRRVAIDKVKSEETAKKISKDDSKGFQDDLQKLTDDFIKKLDKMLKDKETLLLKI